MNPFRLALTLLLTTTLCASGLPAASAAPSRVRSSAPSGVLGDTAGPSEESTPNVADNTLIVRLKGGAVSAEALQQVYEAVDTSAGAVSVIRGDVLSFELPPGETITGFAEQLEDTGQVSYAEPNYVRQLAGYTPPAYVTPNDPAYLDGGTWGTSNWSERYPYAKSWWIRNIKGVTAWKKGYTGSNIVGKYPLRSPGTGVKVAVIDTGFYVEHPDAGSNIVAGSSDIRPADVSSVPGTTVQRVGTAAHGTCVAGLVGAAVANGEGTLGIGNDTRVAIYKVYFGGQGIADEDLIAAIRTAADDGCRVINLSLAGGDYTSALQGAIDYAWGKGCVIVAASGNEGVAKVSYPAAMNHVLSVGALGLDASSKPKRAAFSNYGRALDISAPGAWVWGLTKPGYLKDGYSEPGYTWWEGTSMASPVVAGSIAWLWRAAPWMTNSQIVSLVQRTATNLGAPGKDTTYGYGNINVDNAYNRLISDYPLLRKPTISVISQRNARNVQIRWTAVPGYAVRYDVHVDGTLIKSNTTATTITLPYSTTVGSHVVRVTPKSSRNWADGTQRASVTVRPSVSVPEIKSLRYNRNKLLWSDTEAGRAHTNTLSVDGWPGIGIGGVSWSTNSLRNGSHSASLVVRDAGGARSAPATIRFTVRPSPTVKRITAPSRYGYAAAVSRSAFKTASTAVLVSDGSWHDALSAAPLARKVRGPVLLTSRTSLPPSTKTELSRLRVKNIIIVGNTRDVSSKLRASLKRRYRSVIRVSGSDRYTTANAVAASLAKRSGGRVPGGKVVVVGNSYTDALAASAVAARKGWPLLYTRAAGIPTSTRRTISAIHATSSLVVGGGSKVSATARRQLQSATRVAGSSTLYDPTALAAWATARYPAEFSGERIYLASSTQWGSGMGVPAAAAQRGALVIATTPSLATPVKRFYYTNREVAVTTRVVGSTKTIRSSAATAIKRIVGAP